MKKCPQCNSVFADDNKYCLNDGTVLIKENLSLPSEVEFGEEPTIIRNAPIVVDIAPENQSPQQTPAVQETIILHAPPPKRISKTPKYVVFLILGLLIGGGLVMAAFLLAGKFYQNQNSNAETASANLDSSEKSGENINAKSDKTISDDFGEFNGRVIAVNANLRSEPGLYSEEIAVLPIDEKINIVRRENDNSPWYYVEAENGESGWIHGNTIEFLRQ